MLSIVVLYNTDSTMNLILYIGLKLVSQSAPLVINNILDLGLSTDYKGDTGFVKRCLLLCFMLQHY